MIFIPHYLQELITECNIWPISFLSGAFLKSVLPSAHWDMKTHPWVWCASTNYAIVEVLGAEGSRVALLHDPAPSSWSHPCLWGKPWPWGQEGSLLKGHLHRGLWRIITPLQFLTSSPVLFLFSSPFFFFFSPVHWISVYSSKNLI